MRHTHQPKCQVLFERSHLFSGSGVGALSIKSFRHGEALYAVGSARYRVNDDCYLVLNQGQEYTITIDAKRPVESFCLFFAAALADDVYRSFTTTTEKLVDDPAYVMTTPIQFFERTYRHDDTLSPALQRLRLSYPHYCHDSHWLEENAHGVMAKLITVHHAIQTEVATLSAVRASTRAELYRRLYWARDFIAASFDQPITLDEIASVACLSPNHFLRSFKELFHVTPHQYLTEQRLARACQLLQCSDKSIIEICFDVGFQSVGSFSELFRRRIGSSPAQFRQQKR